ncbi:TolC family protein [Flavobacterium sp. LC2016-01]|uniref:TolC family protein n=1 Tax=Flavobacterium sp. LC2016-01 TaxID=2675876 RepID=UPI0012BA89C9|nr:TolC family protein [Flavobacterium sp. LC2016-01]MTH15833.1 TolC family protein [Flavobacterium sp. LC2016-01]
MKTLKVKFTKHALLFCLMAVSQFSFAQATLDDYIREGIASNQSIKEQDFLLEKSVYALKEAKSLFLPSVTFSTTYTKADGGRAIEFPSGDLLNKAYATLNTLTGTNNFPQLQNQSIQLNPDNFYDAKFRTSLPLLNAELIYNKRIKNQQIDLQKTEVLLYKRELVKEIKKAYYQFAKADNAIKIYESSMKLVKENNRINTALFNNQKINRTAVIRSENEISKINAHLVTAQQNKKSAQSYFNFLLNKPLTDSINVDTDTALPVIELTEADVSRREELAKIKTAMQINENVEGLTKSYIIPKVGTFLDLGSQAFDFKFNQDSRYYLFGVNMEWNLFASGKNIYKRKQVESQQKSLSAESSYVETQLKTQLNIAKNDFQSAVAQHDAAEKQLKTTDQYYKDELRLYKEGQALYIELLDAQNQLINAQLEANIALFDAWIRYADIERATASFNIN